MNGRLSQHSAKWLKPTSEWIHNVLIAKRFGDRTPEYGSIRKIRIRIPDHLAETTKVQGVTCTWHWRRSALSECSLVILSLKFLLMHRPGTWCRPIWPALFETRHLLEHASEYPASIRCRRLFENWDLAFITSFTVITKLITIILSPDFAKIYHICFKRL